MHFDGAIFDIDGVLVDSPHEQAWRMALARLMAGEWAALLPRSGYTPARFTSTVYQTCAAGKPRDEGAQALLVHFAIPDHSGQHRQQYAEQKQATLLGLIERGQYAAFDDGIRLLLRLRAAGLRIAAASSSQNADLFLRRVQLERFRPAFPQLAAGATLLDQFDANVNGRAVPRGKPDPALFLLAADALGCAPARCLVFEDAPAGVRAARAGGMACVAVARQSDAAELRAAGASWVVATLDEVVIEECRSAAY